MAHGKEHQDGQHEPHGDHAARPSLVARAKTWAANARQRPVKAIGMLSVAAVAVVTFATGVAWLLKGKPPEPEPDPPLVQAIKHLESGEYEDAKKVANQMRKGPKPLGFQELGGPMYVLGVAAAKTAEEAANEEERAVLFLIAARYLEDARDRGFPEGREPHGMTLLGTTLFLGREYAEAARVLREALEINPAERTGILLLLAEACLRQKKPDYAAALEFSRQYLASESLSAADRNAMLASQAEAMFRLGDLEGSRKTAEQVSENSPARSKLLVTLGHGLLVEAEKLLKQTPVPTTAAEKLREAINFLRQVQGREATVTDAVRHSQYLLGQCYLRLAEIEADGDFKAAEVQFARSRRAYFHTPEGLAAGLAEADLQRRRKAYGPALGAYQRVIQEAGPPEKFHNPWITLDDLRNRISAAFSDLRDHGHFDEAIELTRSMTPLFPPQRGTQLRAETQRQWAEQLHEQAAGQPASKAAVTRASGRMQFRQAGESFEELASLRKTTREYPDDLWSSADCFLRGRSYEMALRLLDRYLADGPAAGRPRALVAMGEALLARDRLDEALKVLGECIAFHPTSPDCYRARLLSASAQQERGENDEAKRLLEANLYSDDLSPRSIEWRESLFSLGELAYGEGLRLETIGRTKEYASVQADDRKAAIKELERSNGQFAEAVRVLTEAVARYPEATRADFARYLLAETHRRMARLPRKKLEFETIETTRSALRRQNEQELTTAIAGYAELQERLNQELEKSELDELHRGVLRNCYFARADALFDLGRYEDAIQAYSAASNRYLNEPAALEAFAQMAACYRLLNKPVEARGQLEQAKVVLGRIRPDADFARTTRFSRNEWSELLNWLAAL